MKILDEQLEEEIRGMLRRNAGKSTYVHLAKDIKSLIRSKERAAAEKAYIQASADTWLVVNNKIMPEEFYSRKENYLSQYNSK